LPLDADREDNLDMRDLDLGHKVSYLLTTTTKTRDFVPLFGLVPRDNPIAK
jgi:hypothetical protein